LKRYSSLGESGSIEDLLLGKDLTLIFVIFESQYEGFRGLLPDSGEREARDRLSPHEPKGFICNSGISISLFVMVIH
jgi:hypothetical protein